MTDPLLIASIPTVGALLGILLQRDHRVVTKKLETQDDAIAEVHLLVNSRLDALLQQITILKEQLAEEKATITALQATWDGHERRKSQRRRNGD